MPRTSVGWSILDLTEGVSAMLHWSGTVFGGSQTFLLDVISPLQSGSVDKTRYNVMHMCPHIPPNLCCIIVVFIICDCNNLFLDMEKDK